MTKLIASAASILLAVSGSASAQTFDAHVSQARRHMRAACQSVQKIGRAAPADRLPLADSAARDAAEAGKLWASLAGEYAASVPAGYAGDPAWAQRLEDVRINIARMGTDIGAEAWRSAFLSCAHACNLIAAMHEANGVILPIDAMSVLRKKVGTARGLLAAGRPDIAAGLIKEILAARDTVLLVPVSDASEREDYLASLSELSLAVDGAAAAARAGADAAAMKSILDDLAVLVERVYEMAI